MQDIGGLGHQGRALFEEVVAALAGGAVDVAGDRQHRAALIGGEPGRDQRAALAGRLDHQHGQRHRADEAIARGKSPGFRLRAQRVFRDHRALLR